MEKEHLQIMEIIKNRYIFLIVLLSLFMSSSMKAQDETYLSDNNYIVGTSDSRLASTIEETDSSVVMKVIVVGELRANALTFSFFYNPDVLVLSDPTITQEINNIGNNSAHPNLENAIIFAEDLDNKGFICASLAHREKGSGSPTANYSFNPDMRAFIAEIVQPSLDTTTILKAKPNEIVSVMTCFFKKKTRNNPLNLNDIGIASKTTYTGYFYCPKWAYDDLTLSYANDGTSGGTQIIDQKQILYRSFSTVTTIPASLVGINSATVNATFSRGQFSSTDDISNNINPAIKTGLLRCDSIIQYGFIYSDVDAQVSVNEFMDSIVIDDIRYEFPTDTEITNGTFTRGTKTFNIVSFINNVADQNKNYDSELNNLNDDTEYYVWSFAKYEFETSILYPLIGNKITFTTNKDCIPIIAGSIQIISQPDCNNATGSIKVYLSGGEGNYEYALNGGSTYTDLPATRIIENLPAGTYRVYLRDKDFPACGISISDPVTLNTNNSNLELFVTADNASSCGISDGSLELYAINGTAPYQYSINGSTMANFPANNTISGLPSGIHIINISDANGCITSSGEILLGTDDDGLDVTISDNTTTICGNTDGSFKININGGTGPYQYQINGGVLQTIDEDTVRISNLSAGVHIWRIFDTNGCYAEGEEEIENSDNDNFTFIANTSNSSCDGTADGTIVIDVTGGVAPFNYSYDNGITWTEFDANTTATINNLPQGSYNLTVKDNTNCIFSRQGVRINKNKSNILTTGTIYVVNQPSCGNNNGSIKITVSGGSGNYQYSLNNNNTFENLPSTGIINNLGDGTYRIYIRDIEAIACGITVSEPIVLRSLNTNLDISVVPSPATSCGIAEGSIEVVASGGVPDYEYTINGTATSLNNNKIENLTPGIYVVNVTDAVGCTASSGEVIINATDGGLNTVISNIIPTLCENTDGSFSLTISGTAPYQYQIDGGNLQATLENTITISNLSAGNHIWRITDATGCYAEDRVNIINTDNNEFAFNVTKINAYCDGTGGSITLNVTGGVSPYTYSIDNGQSWADFDETSSTTITDLNQGSYDIIVKDNTDCTYEYQNIDINKGIYAGITAGTIHVVSQPTCNSENGSIYVFVYGGSGNYEYTLNDGIPYEDLPADNIIENLGAGTYQVYLRDKESPNCGVAISAPVTLRVSDSNLDINITANNANNCGSTDGSLALNIINGTAPYLYSINGSTMVSVPENNTISGLRSGEYVVDVMDDIGCIVSSGQIILGTEDAGLNATVSDITTTTCNNALGSFILTVDGTAPYLYQIDNGIEQNLTENSILISKLNAGSHTWRITDANGCFAEGREEIENSNNGNLAFDLTSTDALCDGTGGGSITISITNGNSPFEYSLDNGINWETINGRTATISDLAQGSYYIMVQDATNCIYKYHNANIDRSENSDLIAGSVQVINQPTCNREDGSIKISVSGDGGNYEYALNGGTTYTELPASGIIEDLAAGTYRVYIRDRVFPFCGVSVSAPITLESNNSDLEFDIIANDASSCGVNNGSLKLFVLNGTAPYQYSLNGSVMADIPDDNTINGLTSGLYIVNVSDANGCIVSSETMLKAGDGGLNISISDNTATTCGYFEGGFKININGGTAPFKYQINGGILQTASENNITISNLNAGVHTWRIFDANGCYAEGREEIENNDNNNFAYTVNTNNSSCDGTSGGSITISVTGGTAPFEYTYDNGVTWTAFSGTNTTVTINNLSQGSYNLIVRDNIDCLFSYQDIRINKEEGTNIAVGTIKLITQPTCGNDEGEIQVIVTGGSGTYQYSLNNGNTFTDLYPSGIISDLSAGTYRVYIQDKNATTCGTVVSEAISLHPVDSDIAISVVANNASMCGISDGSLTVVVTGGVTPYEFTLNSTATSLNNNKIEDLTSGIYVVNVTDSDGCIASSGEIILNADNGGLNAVTSDNVATTCGNAAGSFRITVSGTAPYQYQIDGGILQNMAENSVTISNLNAGSHVWRIFDANGCYAEGREEIENSDNNNLAFSVTKTDSYCDGTNGGSITITIINGNSPYEYSINNGNNWIQITGTSVVIPDLAEGSYDVIVRDDADCTYEYQNISINRSNISDLIVGTIKVVSLPTCNDNSGSIQVYVNGGSGNYEYSLNNNNNYTDLQTNGLIENLSANTYQVSIRDKDRPICGVTTSESVILSNTDSDLHVSMRSTNASGCGIADGSLIITATGGASPYAYTLNGSNITPVDNIIDNQTSGVYVLNIVDANNCSASTGEVIINSDDNGLNAIISDVTSTLCGNSDGSFTITVTGTAPYQYQIDGGILQNMTENSVTISDLTAGNHVISIKDLNNCYSEQNIIIENEDNNGFAVAAYTTNVQCDGTTGGSITLNVTGGTAPYQYSMDNGTSWTNFSDNSATTEVLENIAQGNYDIIVKDAVNCTYEYQNVTILQIYNITPPTVNTPQTFCSNATILNLEATGLDIKWYDSQTGGIALEPSTVLIHDNIYYASQSTGLCESEIRTAVKIYINDYAEIDAPRINSPQELCSSATLADIAIPEGIQNNIIWYDAALNGNQLPLTTEVVNGNSYYAAYSAGGNCQSSLRTEVEIIIDDNILEIPTITSPQSFCENTILANISVPNNQIKWYTAATGGSPIESGTILTNGDYYAAQSGGTCESSERIKVTINIGSPSAPVAPATQGICEGDVTLGDLTITGSGIVWFTTETGTDILPLSTILVTNTTYYAAQTSINCEGDRIAITTTSNCFSITGTVFPFVHENDPEFNSLFPVSIKLYPVPPQDTEDPLRDLFNSTPLYRTSAIYYDGSIFIPGTPKNPGTLNAQDNPGLPIDWALIGKTQGDIDNTPLAEGELPDAPIGMYMIERVHEGDYILEISRQGYIIRLGKITISSDTYLGHREILPGDVNSDFYVNAYDLSKINSKESVHQGNVYDPKYDFNANGTIDFREDNNTIISNFGASIEIYIETQEWLRNY
ncbi:MAG: hypothetical protein LBQ22_01480 [Bacteroidales bacterium]|jgi:hypothetical protein|nr:hypothetical protein [Bacteroidales bacterium]